MTHFTNKLLIEGYESNSVPGQGPLKKWTEHSQELHLLKMHSRGGFYSRTSEDMDGTLPRIAVFENT
jgi:hypothetical protein